MHKFAHVGWGGALVVVSGTVDLAPCAIKKKRKSERIICLIMFEKIRLNNEKTYYKYIILYHSIIDSI